MKYQDTVDAVNRIISGYTMPLTLRQIYYRLVAGGFIRNARSEYNGLSAQLVKARELGEVDENKIIDRSRRIDDLAFDSPEQFLLACRHTLKQRHVRRFWDTQSCYVEVWVEKDALSGVIANAVSQLNTIVAPSRGYSSYSYLKDAAERISRYSSNKTAIILHFGDHDPSGLDMSRDLQERFDKYSRGGSVDVRRIALTFEQVKHYKLIPNPTKLADPRSAGYVVRYGKQCWELDAIEPNELVRICRDAVKGNIRDQAKWDGLAAKDKRERGYLMDELYALEGRYENEASDFHEDEEEGGEEDE